MLKMNKLCIASLFGFLLSSAAYAAPCASGFSQLNVTSTEYQCRKTLSACSPPPASSQPTPSTGGAACPADWSFIALSPWWAVYQGMECNSAIFYKCRRFNQVSGGTLSPTRAK